MRWRVDLGFWEAGFWSLEMLTYHLALKSLEAGEEHCMLDWCSTR